MAIQPIDTSKSAGQLQQALNGNFEELYAGAGGVNTKLKILVVANSHGFDCWSYVPFILKEYGVYLELGMFYVAGQSISGHKNNYYNGESYSQGNNPRCMFIDTSVDTSWKVAQDDDGPIESVNGGENASVHRAVCCNDWNMIVLMGSHTTAFQSDAFAAVDDLYDLIAADLEKPFMLGLMTSIIYQGWQQEAMLANVKNSVIYSPFDIVFPCGTAIYNAQQNATLDAINTHLFNGDKVHLNEGMPCYIAALANVEKIFRTFYPHLSVLNDLTRPTSTWLSNKNVPGQQGTVDNEAVTDENCYLAQRMALLANDFPFEIANKTFTVNYSLNGAKISGTLRENVSPDATRINTGSFSKLVHSDLFLRVGIWTGQGSTATSLDSVSFTYEGVTHNCTIVDNEANIFIHDVTSDVTITAQTS